ncbi:MAG TPA: hypothetical protein VGQ86_11580 [Candidatus Limnocylindria bacterium]|nr:hypothetical protein [Candidatus Limnocylindria bacterium]
MAPSPFEFAGTDAEKTAVDANEPKPIIAKATARTAAEAIGRWSAAARYI